MKRKLQFTFFAKTLALTSTVSFAVFFYYYQNLVVLFHPLIAIQEYEQSLFWMSYFTLSIMAIGLVCASYLLSLTITKPIQKLLKLTQSLSKGEFEGLDNIKEFSSDEIGELSHHLVSMSEELKKREKAQHLLHKLHGKALTQQFMTGALENQAQMRNVVVMFIDIKGFTDFAGEHSPQVVLEKLNQFFEQCGKVISKSDGIIDKFMGDSLMATWGILSSEKPEENSLDCCINQAYQVATEIRELKDSHEFEIGIGLHYGPAILGSVGTAKQKDYTIIGDTVNTAAKLQQCCRELAAELIISHSIYEKLERNHQEALISCSYQIPGKSHKSQIAYMPSNYSTRKIAHAA